MKYLGSVIEVKTFVPINAKKKFKGKLEEVTEDLVILLANKEKIVIPRDKISKANTTWEDK